MTTQNFTPPKSNGHRLLYIDNLRILLTILVILLHLSIGYGAPGDWYYNEEGQIGTVSSIVMTLFVALNQSFFMGFFFMLSSYFSPGSLDRKGAKLFLMDRLKRLGIPILFYALVLNPLLEYALAIFYGYEGSFWQALREGYFDSIAVGPMWFIEALLLFAILYVLWRRIKASTPRHAEHGAPRNGAIALFALVLGLITFVVRIWLPVGWWLEPFHFQLAHFPQYIALYILGIIAYQRNWFGELSDRQGRTWLWVTIALIVIFPIIFIAGGALQGNLDPFIGGWHWQSLAYSIWEQVICLAIVVTLLVWYRNRYNNQGKLGRLMSGAAYGTYIVHAPVITLLALALSGIKMDLTLKFVVVAPVAVAVSFLAGYLVKKLPVAQDIL
jgi:surface polysaccharide O-acyltransferase-like enzyme